MIRSKQPKSAHRNGHTYGEQFAALPPASVQAIADQVAAVLESRLAKLSQLGNTSRAKGEGMATKTVERNGKAGKHRPRENGESDRGFKEAPGTGWAARIARGLTRWRKDRELSIPAASDRLRLNQTNWYRIERATHPATTAAHIDDFCEAIGLDVVELIQLGT